MPRRAEAAVERGPVVLPAWVPGPAQAIALVVALLFLAGVVGYAIGRPKHPRTNDADIGFLEDMTAHHEQAIAMSFTFLQNAGSDDPLLVHTAQGIVRVQSAEIRVMNELLQDWDEDGDPDVAMEWMDQPVAQNAMPGLATSSDLRLLDTATGRVAEELYSRLIIRHHQGGADMAEAAADLAASGEVRELASKMAKSQRAEILELETRRRDLGFAPLE